ncbi:histidine kinase [Pseudonocardia nematodicida]|uniref:Histidine kinase n=1 Tax=Pseudonocardia nematodicida TaxID=1206997 RepID=A0ABV1K4D2_9PSEU
MTSVTGPVGGFGLVRGYLRSGLVFTALVFCGMPTLMLLDGRWPHPVVHPLSLLLSGVAVAVFAGHTVLVRPAGTAAGRSGQGVAAGLLVLSVAAFVLTLRTVTAAAASVIWLLLVGQALSVLLAARGWRRREVAGASVLVVALIVASVAGGVPFPVVTWMQPLLLLLLLAGPAAADLASVGMIRVMDRLEQARRDADELATTRERVRIAAELHDVQGHSLHAIALHAELTERLVGTDPQTAATHARTVRTLAADALAETRALVRGYRDADLSGELRNAAGLLRAAGADAEVTGDPSAVPAVHAVLLGPIVREAATNVLRHSDPARVRFTVRRAGDRTELEVYNDGVGDDAAASDPHSGTGLTGVRDRVGKRGGRVEAGPDGTGGFRLRVVLLSGADELAPDATEVRA